MKYLSGWSSLLGTPKLLIGNFLSWANGFGFTVMVIFIHMPKGLLVCVYKSNKYLMITKFKITPKNVYYFLKGPFQLISSPVHTFKVIKYLTIKFGYFFLEKYM